MTEQEAIDKIKDLCHSGDFEGNGCFLDRIVQEFLKSQGFAALADEITEVECWRA